MSTRSAPYPPLELANRVSALSGSEDPMEEFDRSGSEEKRALLKLLPPGWSFRGKRVLDFGCGSGRTLRHFLSEAEAGEFWGADIDSLSIDWLECNLSPPFHLIRSQAEPPLGLEHGTFDLIWALSVFTHLTDNSLAWLRELHSLLRPGGLLIASYMGRWTSIWLLSEPWDENSVGMNVLRTGQGWDAGGPLVLMSDWWVREHWGRAFEIDQVLPEMNGQTWVLLRKREVDVTVEELERPGDDPREYAALKHNIRQVEADQERTVAELRREYEQALFTLAAGYEQSLSWRLTQPLRSAKRAVRSRRLKRPRSAR